MNTGIFDLISDDRAQFLLDLTIDTGILNTVFSPVFSYLGTSTMI